LNDTNFSSHKLRYETQKDNSKNNLGYDNDNNDNNKNRNPVDTEIKPLSFATQF